jgi:hypothetical protein
MNYTKKIKAYKLIDEVTVVILDNDKIDLHIPSTFSGDKLRQWKCENKDEYEAFKATHIVDYKTDNSIYNKCYEDLQK